MLGVGEIKVKLLFYFLGGFGLVEERGKYSRYSIVWWML